MESGIDYKGLLFAFDENTGDIKVWQGEVTKVSLSGLVSTYITKFIIWKNELYALESDGHLYKLIRMITGSEDDWQAIADANEVVSDMVIYNGYIYIIGSSKMFIWNGSVLSNSTALPASHTYYCGVSAEENIYLFGDDGTYTVMDSYNGSSFTQIFTGSIYGTFGHKANYTDFYNVKGKPLILEYKGKIYFTIRYQSFYTLLKTYDISSNKTSNITLSGYSTSITEWITAMIIDDGMLLMTVFDEVNDRSNIRVHIIDDYTKEQEISLGDSDKIGKLYRVESDPIMASMHDRERLVYHPQYTCLGIASGMKPIFKYGKRLEFYTDLFDMNIGNISLKDIADNMCNILDAYVTVRPENIIETDIKDLSGKSDIFLTLSDSDAYGDIQIEEVEEYIQGVNNFRRIMINWEHALMDGGQEMIGATSNLNVNEFSYDSPLINSSILAKNIAMYLFGKMYSADVMKIVVEYAPFLRVNQNFGVKAISNNLYLGNNKEFKIIGIEHSWDSKTTKLTLAERNIIFKTLEI